MLRHLGYDIVCYFFSNYVDLKYYRDPQRHITKIKDNYDILKTEQKRWYIFRENQCILSKTIKFYEFADELTKTGNALVSLDHYFSFSEYKNFLSKIEEIKKMVDELKNREFEKYLVKKLSISIYSLLPNKEKLSSLFEDIRQSHNNGFVKKELIENKEYFDTLLKYPLDQQQRESIVVLEDNCLVVSSAGSGKTSTSIAKVKYLLDKRHLSKDEILVLSYNRKTANEFQKRLNIPELTCKTFHALAMSIIGSTNREKPDVCEQTLLLECYYSLVKRDENFKSAIITYVTKVASLTKLEHDYLFGESEQYYNDRKTYGIMAPYGDMNGTPIYTRSEEEKKICTWLSEHGIEFQYEEKYPIDTADQNHRQYKPDFTLYSNGKKVAFLEHFAIDVNGNVPRWFQDGKTELYITINEEYNEGIKWKRNLHQKYNTCLLETTSAMFHDGTIFDKLKLQLENIGLIPKEISTEEKYHRLFKRDSVMEESIMNLFSSFISLMKSSGKTFDDIMNVIKAEEQTEEFCRRSYFFMYNVVKPLYEEYQATLKRKKQMDFTDLILYATELCKNDYKSPYSYIIVDEFQDISLDRYKFILSLRNNETKTFCVGDDWQSIYRFSGSDMNLFNHFEKYFGYTVRCKIETTYRFGNPLVTQSSKFILKNPSQIQKVVQPYESNLRTNLSFIAFSKDSKDYEPSSYLSKIKAILDKIPSQESIMLIARYNSEVNKFPKNCVEPSSNGKRATVTFAGHTMQFMSIHAAKGLEADNVLILNCSQDNGGFPSRITDDPILGYVLSEIDTYEYSEERRLFYVAITRAKRHTYVLYNEKMPSEFVTEMLANDAKHLMLCPVCKDGQLKVAKEGQTKNKKNYRIYLCSNSISGCSYDWHVFYSDENEIMSKYKEMLNDVKITQELEQNFM